MAVVSVNTETVSSWKQRLDSDNEEALEVIGKIYDKISNLNSDWIGNIMDEVDAKFNNVITSAKNTHGAMTDFNAFLDELNNTLSQQ